MFFSALVENSFLQNALMGALLACVACAMVGPFVVVRKLNYLVGGISHSVLGGVGVAYFFGASPLLGIVGSAILAALILGWISLRSPKNQSTLISALWAGGMALGIMLISQTPGYASDLSTYLFGNILMVPAGELWMMFAFDVVVVVVISFFYKEMVALSFDEEFCRLRGLPVVAFHYLFLLMVSLTVVLLVQMVGLILVLALMAIPVAMARPYAKTIRGIIGYAALVGVGFSWAGIWLSFELDTPSGATIILLLVAAYVFGELVSGRLTKQQ